MGGIRCSYRNCSSKSDGVTHFFHYPVFDKLRCHKWLVNAQRMDFLNLKVRQLRSRAVCQHHFTSDSFMNSNRDQLKPGTVPTLNGPFCVGFAEELNDNAESIYVLDSDLIENEIKTLRQKRAESSVKYVDFLTNTYDYEVPIDNVNKRTLTVPNLNYKCSMERVSTKMLDKPKIKLEVTPKPREEQIIQHKIKEGSIHILSQETISEPEKIITPLLKAKKSFQIVNLNQPLKPNKATLAKDNNDNTNNNIHILRLPEHNSILIQNNENLSNENINSNQIVNLQNVSVKAKNPTNKDIIAEKRRFNMKLRDIVAQSIDNLEKKDEKEDMPVEIVKLTDKRVISENRTSDHLSADPNLPNIHQYTIAALEKKLDLMQSLLLNRIDSNTQEIKELKNICSQTERKKDHEKVEPIFKHKDMTNKKHLYNEISKFLPPELNSKIYEELFINQVIENTTNSFKRKRNN